MDSSTQENYLRHSTVEGVKGISFHYIEFIESYLDRKTLRKECPNHNVLARDGLTDSMIST